eukprot:gene1160-1267_t
MESCLNNSDLVALIISYLPCNDLLAVEETTRGWRSLVLRQFDILADDPHQLYKHLCYLRRFSLPTGKKVCCYINQIRQEKTDSLVLLGGSFGSLGQNTVHVDMTLDRLDYSTLKIFPKGMGCQAMTYSDKSQTLYSFGGYQDSSDSTLTSVYGYHLPTKSLQFHTPLSETNCYASATTLLEGDIVLTGGCSSPYQGARVSSACRYFDLSHHSWENNRIPCMIQPRCGHESVTLFNGNMMVIGGYQGVDALDQHCYSRSAEIFDFHHQQWQLLSDEMTLPRSGFASCIGPYGSVYVAGGSQDGSHGTNSVERYDSREGKWESVASMIMPRGYCSGSLSPSGFFYVSGGMHNSKFQGGIELYDFRTNRWFAMCSGNDVAVQLGSQITTVADFPATPSLLSFSSPSMSSAHVNFVLECLRACHKTVCLLPLQTSD